MNGEPYEGFVSLYKFEKVKNNNTETGKREDW